MTPETVSASRVVDAPPEVVFDFLCDPANHVKLDGSDHIVAPVGATRLTDVGDRFGMRMRWIVPYAVMNTVVEFEKNKRIAWRHFGRHRWRYELEPVDGGTKITETFDPRPAPARLLYPILFGYPDSYEQVIERSLEKLDAAISEHLAA